MGNNAGLQQARLANSLIDEISVTTCFKGTPFIAPIRTGFDPSLWGARMQNADDPSTPLLTIYVIRMFYSYYESKIVDSTLFWNYREDFEGWNASWFRSLEARLRSTFKQILRSQRVYTRPNRACRA
jgi:hypothetical protein